MLINVPKLRGRENYDEWAFAAENYLILEGLEKSIKQETETEMADDAKTKAKLIMTIDPSLYVHIKGVSNTKGLWAKLKNMFDDSGFTRRISLLRNLISIRLENCESMTTYVTQIIDTAQKLSGTGFNINDEWIGSLLLAGLPDMYSPMLMAIEHSGIVIMTDSIKTKFLDMEFSTGGEKGTESAFASKNWQQKRTNSWHKNGTQMQKDRNVPGTSNAKMTNFINNKAIKCYNCKQIGHFKNKCPFNVQFNNKNKQTNAFSAVFLNGAFSKDDWYIDSGASFHMTSHEDWMINSSSSNQTKSIMVANNEKLPVVSCGQVQITSLCNGNACDITVKDVLCVPSLATNLLSVSRLISNGNKITFRSDICYIYNQNNELVATASLVNGIYKLNINNTCSYSQPMVAAVISGKTWHRRMAHINSRDLNKMKNGAVKGVDFPERSNIDMSNMCCLL